jgi:adenine-specific DNA-methyltransferase
VTPYRVEWKGHYLHIDSDLLFAGGWDPSIVERPKIMIRQTGDSIIAAVDYDRLYHLNNTHSLAPIGASVSLLYLCAVLNSRLMNRYYHLISLEKGRAMAQTDIETVDLIPIREVDEGTVQLLEALVLRLGADSTRAKVNSDIEAFWSVYTA